MKKQVRIAAMAALLALGGFSASAQVNDPTDAGLVKDKGLKVDPTTGVATNDAKSIKLIDNKGTIKYLQSSNGITQITSTSSGNRTVTTWQLGGTLSGNTYIKSKAAVTTGTAAPAAEFALDGLELIDPLTQTEFDALPPTDKLLPENIARVMSSDADDRSDHGTTGKGFTVLIRDEVSGALKKIKLEDLLEVGSILLEFPATVDFDDASITSPDYPITVTGLPAFTGATDPKAAKLFVFRNGAKLRLGTDFTATTAGTIKIQVGPTVADPTVPVYAGDVFEIQYIK